MIDTGNAALEARDRSGCTALWLAVIHDRMPAVQLLLSYGASTNVADSGLITPLHKAASRPIPIPIPNDAKESNQPDRARS